MRINSNVCLLTLEVIVAPITSNSADFASLKMCSTRPSTPGGMMELDFAAAVALLEEPVEKGAEEDDMSVTLDPMGLLDRYMGVYPALRWASCSSKYT